MVKRGEEYVHRRKRERIGRTKGCIKKKGKSGGEREKRGTEARLKT